MSRPRDSQRSKLYRAEKALGRGRELPTVAEMQEFVDAVQRTRWFKSRYPHKGRVVVRDGRRRRKAAGWGTRIWMPRWSRCEVIVLHEVAHCLQPHDTAWHGREYARIYLALVRRFMGEDAYVKLRDSFREHKVKWHPKRGPQPGRVPPWVKEAA